MRISKLIAVGASGCALVAAVTLPAMAGPAHHARPSGTTGTLHSTLSPKTAHTGTKMTLKASEIGRAHV